MQLALREKEEPEGINLPGPLPSLYLLRCHPLCEPQPVHACNDPDFSRLKISSCIHGILHFKFFSKVLNLILQRILFQMPFTPILETKGISERKYFKMSSIVMELSYIFL
jgi:hypothetical protein